MTRTTVAEFANELKKSTETLLEQLRSAGVPKADAADVLTDADKQKLLGYLQASHGTGSPERKKITLVKKSTSEIKQADATGKARTIQVEVRKKRTFIQRDEPDEVSKPEAEVSAPAAPLIDDAELARREEEARRQAELIRRQEEELVEKRRLRQEQEQREQAEALARAEQAAADAERAKAAADTLAPAAESQTAPAADDVAQVPVQPAIDPAIAAVKAEQERKAAAAKASAEEDAVRAKDLEDRRRKALAEAEAIRAMMNAPKRVLVAKKPEEPAKPAEAKPIKGTLHKPATPAGATPGAARPAATTTGKDGK